MSKWERMTTNVRRGRVNSGATLGFKETLWQAAYAYLEALKQHLKMNIATV